MLKSIPNAENFPLHNVVQNIATKVQLKMEGIPKILKVNENIFFLRGVIGFSGIDRSGLRVIIGHYILLLSTK